METEFGINLQCKNISYLRARDSSILACGHPLENAKSNGGNHLLDRLSDTNKGIPKDDDHLQVYLRLKKIEHFKKLYEIDGKMLLCKVPEGAQCIRNVRSGTSITKIFKFSKIFEPESKQADLFNDVVKEKILRFINGSNGSLLTYGASGSGKTYTIVGTADEPGIIPRALEYLFRTLPQLPEEPQVKPTDSGKIIRLSGSSRKLEKVASQNLLSTSTVNIDRAQHTQTYKAMQQRLSGEPAAVISADIRDISLAVWISFAEIYNESVYDLLTPQPARGQSRKKLRLGFYNGNTYIKDLTNINVTSGLQAYQLLQYGLHNLQYATTSINDHSSRSHSIFTIRLAQSSNTKEGVSISSFNFCDLAGSERIKKTHNVGERLKESNNINTSLLVLGRCISLVREAQKHSVNKVIPFRESKLTQLFQRALLGHEEICMVININPTREMFDESQHVLNFSAIARDVNVEQQQLIQRPHNNRFTQYIADRCSVFPDITEEPELDEIQELQTVIETLISELQQQKLDAEENRQHLIAQYKKLLEETNDHWKERYEELQSQLVQSNRLLMENNQQQGKKRKISVIQLDSSSEDENVFSSNENLIIHQKELMEAKILLETKDREIQRLTEENKSLEKTLLDATKAYKDLEVQYQTETQELNKKLIQQQDEISTLTEYRENFHALSGSDSDKDEEYNDVAALWYD